MKYSMYSAIPNLVAFHKVLNKERREKSRKPLSFFSFYSNPFFSFIPNQVSLALCTCPYILCLQLLQLIHCAPNLPFLVLSAMPKHQPKYKQVQYKATTRIIKAQIK